MPADFSALPPRRVSAPVLLLVYLAWYMFGAVLVAAIYMVADQFLTSSPQSSAMGVVIPMVAGMSVAGYWAKREGRPGGGRQWRIALLFALVTVVLNGALIWLIASSGVVPELSFPNGFTRDDLTFGSILGAALLVILLLVIRFGFWMGFRGWEKQQARLAAAKNRPPR
ncbi:ABZJ_00895 family protein [Pseudogemmobacter bohemicus]|uniref:ABZJ_00895 family protein n=1 Tax=Pseudogemmobacter bohemicus TaxID=2250708 RepID=UPI000DD2F8B3|nr:ABZJ_00895 family protein [Pseudogemmobacter bohemicus]